MSEAHFGCGESKFFSCAYYVVLMLFTFSPLLHSFLTLLSKMQICSKVWYSRENLNIIKISRLFIQFHLWEIQDQCRKLHPPELHRNTQKAYMHSSNGCQLPQLTLYYEPHPSTSGVSEKPAFYPFIITHKLQTFNAHFYSKL